MARVRARTTRMRTVFLIALLAACGEPPPAPVAPAPAAPPAHAPSPAPHAHGSMRILTSMPAGLQGEAELIAGAPPGPCRDRADLTFRSEDGHQFHMLVPCGEIAGLQVGRWYAVLGREIPHTQMWRAEWVLEPRH